MPRLHLIGLFHTQHTQAYSHCAFTGKALRFPKMMKQQGYTIIEYSNEGSESCADEHVVMMSKAEFSEFYNRKKTDFHGDDATVGSDGHRLFEQRLIPALRERLQPEDIICHPFGHAHQYLMAKFPHHQHVETGIGYPTLMPDSFRIFESYAWMHYHQGKEGRNGRNYEWVVPNYYDLDDWEPNYQPGNYLAFLGRITPLKGLDTIRAIADHSPWPIVLHGQGDPTQWTHPNIQYRGPIAGRERSEFLRNARALLAPTVFTEPFCGMAVEAMLCGTPVVAVDYGAMTETVIEGVSGYRCHTLQDWIDGIHAVGDLDRRVIADIARGKWSLEACGKRYDKIFKQLNDLHREGWYQITEEEDIYDHEKSFWGDCTNTFREDQKHYVYAKHMKLASNNTYFDAKGKSILDIGGGPTSMLLKCNNLSKGKVVDPIAYPDWTLERYKCKNIKVLVDCAENINETGWDEVWIYNCLQHTIDPQKIIENAKKSAPILRIFEWIDIPPHDGHPHELTEEKLNSWIGQKGETTELAESGCYGRAYYGCFEFARDTSDLDQSKYYEADQIDYHQIENEEGPFAKRLAEWIALNIQPSNALDIGCGPGTYVNAMRKCGINAIGIDNDPRVIGKEHLSCESLLDTVKKSELVICLEVAEHIEPKLSESVAKSVADAVTPGGLLIWSAAIPGQGGTGHINCRVKEEWSEMLILNGLRRQSEMESRIRQDMLAGYHMGWFVNNVMVFTKLD